MNTASKTRKPQTNNFTSILDQILKKYNLSTESNPSQLCVYASELGAMLPDWKARKNVKEALRRRQFKEEQIKALVPDKRNEKLTIRERVQYCAKSGDPYDIYLHALDLVKTKNDSDEEIVASSSRLSLFRKELKESGVDSKVIDIYAKFPALTQDSNEIQKKQLVQRLTDPFKTSNTPKHFSLDMGLGRIQNIDTTKIPTMQDLADVIMMLSMRPAEITTLRIIHYEPDETDPPEWYKPGYSWYCTGYIKNKGEKKVNPEPRQFLSMEKNPKRARELLTWIQNAIATKKLRHPVYSDNGKRNTRAFSKFLKPYGIIAKRLRKIGGKHASRVHGGQNPMTQRLNLLARIAMRHKIDRFDSGTYYAEGDTSSDSDSDTEPEPKSQPKNNDLSKKVHYNPFDVEIAEIDSMLAHKYRSR
ncbi:1584_t:CDS:1 [Entrophospora sp. SA101]|nr:1584_t:CDS:1 [Entrophospora sp. SA101]